MTAGTLISPSVYGQLVDRYLFNFRVDPDALQERLPPGGWLRPRLVNGSGVVSFCLLRLKGVTLWPLPTFAGIDSISCAYRCAVTDASGARPEPSVYILGRSTDVLVVSRLGTRLFAGEMPLVRASINESAAATATTGVSIDARYPDGRRLFAATVRPAAEGSRLQKSRLFGTPGEFVAFIKRGLSSYTPSTRPGRYSRVDLAEDSNSYRAVDAAIGYSWLESAWKDAGVEFDSAFHATGGLYRLKYLGSKEWKADNDAAAGTAYTPENAA